MTGSMLDPMAPALDRIREATADYDAWSALDVTQRVTFDPHSTKLPEFAGAFRVLLGEVLAEAGQPAAGRHGSETGTGWH